MKKTYIEPKTTVVALNVRNSILQASNGKLDDTQEITNESYFGARENIKVPDAWEEW